MVFIHLPSNILLILVPLMPNLPLAIFMLMLRFSISQPDEEMPGPVQKESIKLNGCKIHP